MENSLIIPAAFIGVVFIVSAAIFGVAHLSGSPVFPSSAPPNMAPLESPTPYAVGDLLQSVDSSHTVIVTAFDPGQDLYSYQQVVVNISTGSIVIVEGTKMMKCEEFEIRYPQKVFLNS